MVGYRRRAFIPALEETGFYAQFDKAFSNIIGLDIVGGWRESSGYKMYI